MCRCDRTANNVSIQKCQSVGLFLFSGFFKSDKEKKREKCARTIRSYDYYATSLTELTFKVFCQNSLVRSRWKRFSLFPFKCLNFSIYCVRRSSISLRNITMVSFPFFLFCEQVKDIGKRTVFIFSFFLLQGSLYIYILSRYFYYYHFFLLFSFHATLNLWRINTWTASRSSQQQASISNARKKNRNNRKENIRFSPRTAPIEHIYCHTLFLHNQLFLTKYPFSR